MKVSVDTECRSVAEACNVERVGERSRRTSRLSRWEEVQQARSCRTGNVRHDRCTADVGHGVGGARPCNAMARTRVG